MFNYKPAGVDEALSLIKSDDIIVLGLYTAEPRKLLRNLHTIAPRVRNVKFWTALMKEDYEFFAPEYADSFFMDSIFYGPQARKAHDSHLVSYFPLDMRNIARGVIAHAKPTVYLGAASMPDEEGYVYLAPSVQYEVEAYWEADVRILELNPRVPRVAGCTKVHLSGATCYIESDETLFEAPVVRYGDAEKGIAEYVQTLINDGDTVQFGIGNTSTAIAERLTDKNDLGVYTELYSETMGRLAELGVINNSRKTIFPGKTVFSFAWGDQKFFDSIDMRPELMTMRAKFLTDPYNIAKNDDLVSVNTAIQLDLTGQICSESIGVRQYSGTGGAFDFAMGAYMSKGGRSIIAVPSTVKNGEISRIRAVLDPGAAVSVPRNMTDYVVTEYGIAHLKNQCISERVRQLIAIAHPKFRDELTEEAKRYKLW